MYSGTRYFVVKAPRENVDLSLKSGLWATQLENEHKLSAAYHEGPVKLLFSAVKSQRFLGFATMASAPSRKYKAKWKCPTHIELGDSFQVPTHKLLRTRRRAHIRVAHTQSAHGRTNK